MVRILRFGDFSTILDITMDSLKNKLFNILLIQEVFILNNFSLTISFTENHQAVRYMSHHSELALTICQIAQ